MRAHHQHRRCRRPQITANHFTIDGTALIDFFFVVVIAHGHGEENPWYTVFMLFSYQDENAIIIYAVPNFFPIEF